MYIKKKNSILNTCIMFTTYMTLFLSIGAHSSSSEDWLEENTNSERGVITGTTKKVIDVSSLTTLDSAVVDSMASDYKISLPPSLRAARPTGVLLNQLKKLSNSIACSVENYDLENICYSPPSFSSNRLCLTTREHSSLVDFGVSFTPSTPTQKDDIIIDLPSSGSVCFEEEGVVNIYKSVYNGDYSNIGRIVVNNNTLGKGVAVAGSEINHAIHYLEPTNQPLTKENAEYFLIMRLTETPYGYSGNYDELTSEEKIIAHIYSKIVTSNKFYGTNVDVGVIIDDQSKQSAHNSWQLPFEAKSTENPNHIVKVKSPAIRDTELKGQSDLPICIPSNFNVGDIYGIGYEVGNSCVATSAEGDNNVLYGSNRRWATSNYMILTKKNVSGWKDYSNNISHEEVVKGLFEDGDLYPICRTKSSGYQRLGFVVDEHCVSSRWAGKHKFVDNTNKSQMSGLNESDFQVIGYKNAALAAITESQMLAKEKNDSKIKSDLDASRNLDLSNIWSRANTPSANYTLIQYYRRYSDQVDIAPLCKRENSFGVMTDSGCQAIKSGGNISTIPNSFVLDTSNGSVGWLKASRYLTPWYAGPESSLGSATSELVEPFIPTLNGLGLCRDTESHAVGTLPVITSGPNNISTKPQANTHCDIENGFGVNSSSTSFEILSIVLDNYEAQKVKNTIKHNLNTLQSGERGTCKFSFADSSVTNSIAMNNIHDCANLFLLGRGAWSVDPDQEVTVGNSTLGGSKWIDMWINPNKPGVNFDIKEYFNLPEDAYRPLNQFIYHSQTNLTLSKAEWSSNSGSKFVLYE